MTHAHPEYSLPPELAKDGLRIVALGGLGEIGRNMTVFEFNGKLLIVDVGVLFPEENQPGIDLILPDFSYIRGRLNDIEAVILGIYFREIERTSNDAPDSRGDCGPKGETR
jgi:ribonuclease J